MRRRYLLVIACFAALVGSPFGLSPVVAQTSGGTILLTLRVNGQPPAATNAVGVRVYCRGLADVAEKNIGTWFPIATSTVSLTFALQTGTNCWLTAIQQNGGFAADGPGVSSAGWVVSWGGATSTSPLAGAYTVTGGIVVQTMPLPVFSSTSVNVTLTFPSIAVRKIVLGEEPSLGQAYPMALTCSNGLTVLAPTPAFLGGTFSLRNNERRVFGFAEFEGLTGQSVCTVRETDSKGASVSYGWPGGISSTPIDTAPANGSELLVVNSYTGNLVITKQVQGLVPPGTEPFETSLACDRGGPRLTFNLAHGESRRISDIATGTNCLVTETRSRGAVATYLDDGDGNPTDGRVRIQKVDNACQCVNVVVTNTFPDTPPTTVALPITRWPQVPASPGGGPPKPR
jgi:Domain of unknown function (DUF5979)